MAHHFIMLRLNPFGLRVDREGWWFEHSVSYLRVCLSAANVYICIYIIKIHFKIF